MTDQEILDNYRKICDEHRERRPSAPDAAEAIEALHPFTVSRVARFCADERDLEYIRRSTNPVHLLGDALTAPSSKVPPKEKAAIWLDYVRIAPIDAYLARLVSKKVPGCEDFRNLSPDGFHGRIHVTGFDPNAKRADARTEVEPFLRGETSESVYAISFLRAARKDAAPFPVREMFLYACAHCGSVERFAYVLGQLRPKLGRADFVDALGYSPFFYAAYARVLADEDELGRWLARGEGRAFCELIRKAGARPDRKCRYGFSWRDLEAAALARVAARAADSDGDAEAAARGGGPASPFEPTVVPEPLPVPSDAPGLRRLLLDDPDRGIAALLAMDYEPESLENPFGPRERILSDAICDRSLPRPTRVRLLRLCNDPAFADLPTPETKGDVPTGFLDSRAGRRWTCESGRPGCDVVRCSDSSFFKKAASFDSWDWENGKVKVDSDVKKAIDADSPAQLMMRLGVLGRGVDLRTLVFVLSLCRTKILEWLMENDEGTKALLDPRRMLFYVCAHWPEKDAVAWLERAEAAQPGILKSCADPLGRNLLWYGRRELADALLAHGCDPDAETVWGLSWRDLREASDAVRRTSAEDTIRSLRPPPPAAPPAGFEIAVNGKAPSAVLSRDARWNDEAFARAERVETLRVVQSGTGRTFEWRCPPGSRGVLTDLGTYSFPVPGFILGLKLGWRLSTEICFDLGADGLFRIEREDHEE